MSQRLRRPPPPPPQVGGQAAVTVPPVSPNQVGAGVTAQVGPPSSATSGTVGTALDSDPSVEQIAQETGYDPMEIRADIQKTGAQTKEQLYPDFYQSQASEQAESPAAEQAEPGMNPDQQGAPPQGIPPEVMQAVHKQLAPRRVPSKMYRGERRTAAPPARGPAWHQTMRARKP